MSTLRQVQRLATVCLCIFALISYANAYAGCSIGKRVQDSKNIIEYQDRIILESFFRNLLTRETLGYVLLGEKPVAFLSYIPELSWKSPFQSFLRLKTYLSSDNQIQKKGWTIWEKYSLQTSDRFLFIKEKSLHSPFCTWIFVINRDLFCEIVNKNHLEFETIVGKNYRGSIV